MGDMPEMIPVPGDWLSVPSIGFVLVVERTSGGAFLVQGAGGQQWILDRDFAVECFRRASPYA
jgi:hypothetical protein